LHTFKKGRPVDYRRKKQMEFQKINFSKSDDRGRLSLPPTSPQPCSMNEIKDYGLKY
jgi:hypothetical protein